MKQINGRVFILEWTAPLNDTAQVQLKCFAGSHHHPWWFPACEQSCDIVRKTWEPLTRSADLGVSCHCLHIPSSSYCVYYYILFDFFPFGAIHVTVQNTWMELTPQHQHLLRRNSTGIVSQLSGATLRSDCVIAFIINRLHLLCAGLLRRLVIYHYWWLKVL